MPTTENRTPERDWKTDPQPGDVARGKRRVAGCGNSRTFTVTYADVHHIHFDYGLPRWGTFMTRSSWRKWAATAQIIKLGPAPGQEKGL